MAKENSFGLMPPDTKENSEIMKSQVLVDMIGLIRASMKVKYLTDLDMVKVLTRILRRALSMKESGKMV